MPWAATIIVVSTYPLAKPSKYTRYKIAACVFREPVINNLRLLFYYLRQFVFQI